MARRAPSWTDFYAQLMSGAKDASLARSLGASPSTVALNYAGRKNSGVGGMSLASSTPKRQKSTLEQIANVVGTILNPIGSQLIKGVVGPDASEDSAGSRILDVMSRPAYASANYNEKLLEQIKGSTADGGPPDQPNLFDPEALKALWSGLQGESKRTYSDVLRDQGAGSKTAGGVGFALDVFADPTSYIGAGAVKSVIKGGKGLIGTEQGINALRGERTAASAVGNAERPVLEGSVMPELAAPPNRLALPPGSSPVTPAESGGFAVGSNGQAQSLDEFLKYLDTREARAANGMPGDVFAAPVERIPGEAAPAIPEGMTGMFHAGPEGVIGETRQLPGPTPDVITGRAELSEADELAQQGMKWRYGDDVLNPIRENAEAIDSGWWKPETTRVPIEQERPMPGGNSLTEFLRDSGLESDVMKQNRAIKERYAYFAENGDADIAHFKDPFVKAVMSRVDEKVYTEYHPKEISVSNGKGGQRTQTVWEPSHADVVDENFRYMGEIREKLANPATPPAIKKELQSRLLNHLRAVKQYAESQPPGFRGEKGKGNFIKEMYGKDISKSEMPALPEAPFKAEPKYNEITEYRKMDPEYKREFLNMLVEKYGITQADVVYLSKAANYQSYQTRLHSILFGERGVEPITGIDDAIEAIRKGQISDPADVAALMKKFDVKTVKQLAAAVEKKKNSLTKAERRMLGKIVPDLEGNVTPKGIVRMEQREGGIKELGPTGAPYKEYTGSAKAEPVTPKGRRLAQQVKEAKAKAATVPKTQQIVDEVKQGNKVNLVEPSTGLRPSQQGMAARALNRALKARAESQGWKHTTTRTGTKRTAAAGKKGKQIRQDTWASGPQYTMWREVMQDFSSQFKKAQSAGQLDELGLRGSDTAGARADMAYRQVMPVLESIARSMREQGIWGTLGRSNNDTPVGMWDVLDSIDPLWVKRNIFHMPGRKGDQVGSIVAPTQLMDAVDIGVTAMRNGSIDPSSVDEISHLIWQELKTVKKTAQGNPIPNKVLQFVNETDERAVEDFLSPIIDALPDLVRRAEKYDAERALFHDNAVSKGTKTGLDRLAAATLAPDSTNTKLMALANELDGDLVPKISRLHGLDEADEFMVRQELNAVADEFGLTPEVRATAKRAHLKQTKVTRKDRYQSDVDGMRETIEAVNRDMDELGIPLEDAETRFDNHFLGKMIREIFPHFGNERLRPLYLNRSSAMQTIGRHYHGELREMLKTHGSDNIKAAFNNLQVGRWSDDPALRAAQQDMNKAIHVMFGEEAPYSVYARNSLTAKELNAHFDHFGIPDKYRFDGDETMFDQWKRWDSDDPLNLLSKVMAATTATLGKKTLGDHLVATFGSATRKPGYVKLQQKGEIMRYIDANNTYFPKDVAREMSILNKFLEQTMNAKPSSGFWRFYDEALHSLKSGMTIYRPGHHIRNEVGDVWLASMAGVNDPKVYAKAAKIMGMYGGSMKDMGAIGSTLRGGGAINPKRMADKAEDIILTTRVKGKPVKLTAGEIYRGAFDYGLLTDYRSLEDIGGTGKSFFDNLDLGKGKSAVDRLRAPTGGRAHKVAAAVSEGRDHHVRLAHLIDYLQKNNFSSLEDAFDNGAAVVRKWHPDGSDLSRFEAKVMRRTVLFYSWIRKAIPLVAEAMVMHPGKALVYPKAMYAIAEAQGIDLESFGDPFPDDQLFPEFITDSLEGPIMGGPGSYKGVSPGIPMMDVLGDYGGDQVQNTLASSLTPALRIPAEIAYGAPDGAVAKDSRTDIPIYDKSDYLDKQIPNSSYFTGLTGQSLTQPWENVGGGEKEKDLDRTRILINFLSGLGLTDQSKASYIKQAKKEQTQRERGR